MLCLDSANSVENRCAEAHEHCCDHRAGRRVLRGEDDLACAVCHAADQAGAARPLHCRKKARCVANGISVLYWDYDQPLTDEYFEQKIVPMLQGE